MSATVEWQDQARPWAEHSASLPDNVRLPVVGDFIVLPGEDTRKVTTVFIGLDGRHIVRVEFHLAPAAPEAEHE